MMVELLHSKYRQEIQANYGAKICQLDRVACAESEEESGDFITGIYT